MAFVDFYKPMFLKSTCDMVLMWFHVDSVSIYTLKSQSSLSLKPNFRGGRTNEQILSQEDTLCVIKNGFASAVKNSLAFAIHCICIVISKYITSRQVVEMQRAS